MLPPTAMLPLMSSSIARLIGDSPEVEVADLARIPRVDDREIGLRQVADDAAAVVAHGGRHGDDFDAGLERGRGCLRSGCGGRVLRVEVPLTERHEGRGQHEESDRTPRHAAVLFNGLATHADR